MDGTLRTRTADQTPQAGSCGSAGLRVFNWLSQVAGCGLVFIGRRPADEPPSFLIGVKLVYHLLPLRTSQGEAVRLCKRKRGGGSGKLLLSQPAKHYSSFIPVKYNKNKKINWILLIAAVAVPLGLCE